MLFGDLLLSRPARLILLDDLPMPRLDDDLLTGLRRRQAGDLLEPLEPRPQILVLLFELSGATAERRIGLPPVDTHLLGALDGGDEETQLDCQQLNVEQVDLYV